MCKAHARAGGTWCMPRGEPSAGRPVTRHAVHGSPGAWAMWGRVLAHPGQRCRSRREDEAARCLKMSGTAMVRRASSHSALASLKKPV